MRFVTTNEHANRLVAEMKKRDLLSVVDDEGNCLLRVGISSIAIGNGEWPGVRGGVPLGDRVTVDLELTAIVEMPRSLLSQITDE